MFVGDTVVATKHKPGVAGRLKGDKGFPDDDEAVAAVKRALG